MNDDDDDLAFKALAEQWSGGAVVVKAQVRRERFDCQGCGACCCNTQRNLMLNDRDYVEVTSTDELWKNKELLQRVAVRNEAGALHLKLVGEEQRCASLDGDVGAGVGCTIYAWRPSGCRRVEAGDEECLRARRKFGLPLTLRED